MKKTIILIIVLIASLSITIHWLSATPPGCYQKIFAIGSTVCHQIPAHSYQAGNIQFPLCARCSGLYLGSFIGLSYYLFQGKKKGLPKKTTIILLAFLFILWAGDGINSFISDFLNRPFLYPTTNATRLSSGFGMGLVMATALVTLFNVSIWKDGEDKPLISSPWQIAGYALLSMLTGRLLTISNEILFQILAYICIGTVLTIITILYTIFWIIVTKKEGQFTQSTQLLVHLTAGFGTAMGQITLLTLLRNWILG